MLATPELEIARNLPPANCAPSEAQRYTRWLATHHYENFNIVSWLLPRRLHQHFYNLYAYCRWSDDLGDEVADPARALELLAAWEDELRMIYGRSGGPSHPVLIALGETIIVDGQYRLTAGSKVHIDPPAAGAPVPTTSPAPKKSG